MAALFGRGHAPFGQQQAAQGTQIVQNAPAGGDMNFELAQIVGNQEQRLFAAGRVLAFGGCDFGLDLQSGFFDGLREQSYILVGTFDAVKRRPGSIAHGKPLRPPPPLVASLFFFEFPHCRTIETRVKP